MNSRERVNKALNHESTDRIPFDLGGHSCTGVHAKELIKLREALNLKKAPPEVNDPLMFTANIDEALRQCIGADCVGISPKGNLLGFRNENYKPWTMPDGTQVMMGDGFEWSKAEDGYTYAYPSGDRTAPPSARMPANGLYFDNITRQEDLDAKEIWNGREDYKDQYTLFTEREIKDIEEQIDYYWKNTEYALIGAYYNGGYGDALHLPGAWLSKPKGIRDLSDWMMYMKLRPEYIKEFFDLQNELAMENLKTFYNIAGNKISAMFHTGSDFGSQMGLLISRDLYRELFMPYHKRTNDWIHEHTQWKTLLHTCGSVVEIMSDLIEAGFDCINPVQVSAKEWTRKY
jgi:hypothetical protein